MIIKKTPKIRNANATSINFSQLDPDTFEHLANCIAVKTLGPGVISFAKGPDAGRDGFFEGQCEYPSKVDRWSGVWYIQSKYCEKPAGSHGQKWLLKQIEEELKLFSNPADGRRWPNNWIIASNIDPSGSRNGTFEKAKILVNKYNSKLAQRVHIWGPKTLSSMLVNAPGVLESFRHLMTPGHILSKLEKLLAADESSKEIILSYLISRQFLDQRYTKLDQAGSSSDTRPGVHQLFIDLPFTSQNLKPNELLLRCISKSSAFTHVASSEIQKHTCSETFKPSITRARTFFVRGGPGQGKSTITQYFAQIHRAALMIRTGNYFKSTAIRKLCNEVEQTARHLNIWPLAPRIPVIIDLKEYARWLSGKTELQAKGVQSYLAESWGGACETPISTSVIRQLLSEHRFFFAFDGLDEVPTDTKDIVAQEVKRMINENWRASGGDHFYLCTSRPQGYSGQFDDIEGATVDLVNLSKELAFKCSLPLLAIDRNPQEIQVSVQTLKDALGTEAVVQLMKTPLQSHIMAIVVRDGGRPPDRRWALFDNFYQIIRRREARNKISDRDLLTLLQEETVLIKKVHDVLGFILHARAESGQGSITSINRSDFRSIANKLVSEASESNVEKTVATLMRATTDRLVLVNTPVNGDQLRFDVRQLQEFFSAEYLYKGVPAEKFLQRFETIAGDPHWTEVTHFAVSALVENQRRTELTLVTKALELLNEHIHPDDSAPRIAPILARGAHIAIRLLHEGVLEQEKSIRALFAHAIHPIVSSKSESLINTAINIRSPNSRRWLVEYLIKNYKIAKCENRTGSILILIHLVEDDAARILELEKLFNDERDDVLSYVINTRCEWKYIEGPNQVPHWFYNFALKQCLSPNWQNRPLTTKSCSKFLLRSLQFKRTHGRSKIDVPLPQCIIDLLFELTASVGQKNERIGNTLIVHRTPFGYFKELNITPIEKPYRSGIIQKWIELLEIANSGDAQSLVDSLKLTIKSNAAGAVFMAPRIRQMLPHVKVSIHDPDILDFIERDLSPSLLSNNTSSIPRERWAFSHFSWMKAPSFSFLKSLIKKDPEAALIAVTYGFPHLDHGITSDSAWSSEFYSMARDALSKQPELIQISGLIWGGLFQAGLNSRTDPLRRRFIEAHKANKALAGQWAPTFVPAPLYLPEEAILIRPAFFAIFRYAQVRDHPNSSSKAALESTAQSMKTCFPEPEKLISCYKDPLLDSQTKVCAYLSHLAIENLRLKNTNEILSEIAAACRCPYGEQFIISFSKWLCLYSDPFDRDIICILNDLVERTCDLFFVEQGLYSVFDRWREASDSPVQKSNIADIFGNIVSDNVPIQSGAGTIRRDR